MSDRVSINPALLTWARERAGVEAFMLEARFPKLAAWEAGEAQPTLKQLEDFAHAVHVPIGYLFLPAPVEETLPVADLRTISGEAAYSLNLRETLYLCQERQDWYRDHARMNGLPLVDFTGSATTASDTAEVAEAMRRTVQFLLDDQKSLPNGEATLRQLIASVENAGVLVMVSGIVGSNPKRALRVEEFRGFALADDLAPLIFINGKDSKAAQLFTLAHELAHLWLGESGVSSPETGTVPTQHTERWCNAVAAEFLMPLQAMRKEYRAALPVQEEMQRLARLFKVSTLVALRRLFDAGFIDKEQLWQQYRQEVNRLHMLAQRKNQQGGNPYNSLGARTSKRFARAVMTSTLEGQTLFRDAFRLLGVKANKTFYTAAQKLGVTI